MRLDDRRRDGVLFGISLSRRLRPVQTAAPQPWGGRDGGGGVRRPGDNIIIFVDDLLPRRAAATQAQLQIWQGGGVERGFSFCRRLLQARRV